MSPIALGLGGAVVGVILLVVLVRVAKQLAHHWHNSHPGLFCSLCRLHRLDRNSRRLLKQVAQCYRLPQPARIFIEPQWLDPARLTALRGRSAEIVALRNRLFEVDPPPAA